MHYYSKLRVLLIRDYFLEFKRMRNNDSTNIFPPNSSVRNSSPNSSFNNKNDSQQHNINQKQHNCTVHNTTPFELPYVAIPHSIHQTIENILPSIPNYIPITTLLTQNKMLVLYTLITSR